MKAARIVKTLLLCCCLFTVYPQLSIANAEDTQPGKKYMYSNKLVDESSPYLLQHAHNPVNWYPWGDEAFAKAKREDKPILLSIGYSTCHWCHVMEEEVFADPEAAALINRIFVPIKVDREERPDIDQVYMTASQIATGSGGWPLNVFMNADKQPFYVTTYIPKLSKFRRLGVMDLLPKIEMLWKTKRAEINKSAMNITNALQAANSNTRSGNAEKQGAELSPDIFDDTFHQLQQQFDPVHAGFGSGQKFPRPHNMRYLLRHWKRSGDAQALHMVEQTLQAMRLGGIYDQIGFGFHRYATDMSWKSPHFEKMLYDQALITMAYVETYAATGKQQYADTVREVITYVLRDMTSTEDIFYSAEDADSEGEEGLFYLWKRDELEQLLGKEDAASIVDMFNVSTAGNFHDEASGKSNGQNIFHRDSTVSNPEQQMSTAVRELLFKHRETRVHPFKDKKSLVDWNGLMIAALAMAGRTLHEPTYIDAANKAAHYILANMRNEDGRLFHRWNSGDIGIDATLDDYAFLIWGLIELYQANHSNDILHAAIDLNWVMIDDFEDEHGGFFLTADNAESLLVRPKEIYDGAIPSGNSVALLNMLRLSKLTGDSGLEEKAQTVSAAFAGTINEGLSAYSQFISGLDFALSEGYEIVIVGNPAAADTQAMLKSLANQFQPNAVVVLKTEDKIADEIIKLAPYTRYYKSIHGKATAYVCQNFSCNQPTTDPNAMVKLLSGKVSTTSSH